MAHVPWVEGSPMKRTTILAAIVVTVFLLVGMAVMLVIQQQALSRARNDNGSLGRQVDDLVAQAAQLAAEKTRLSMLLAASRTNAGVRIPQEPSGELLRLRGEVGRLRVQDREVEQLR